MCTAISYRAGGHFFGRTLDLDCSYTEQITITPRQYPYPFRHRAMLKTHYAILGMATATAEQPLYYDAVNEKGLCMAGLNFPGNAVYLPPASGWDNVTAFELLPLILGTCETVLQAKERLKHLRIVNTPYAPEMPLTPLHWLLADGEHSLVIEPTADGLQIYDNPAAVLTNNPPFPQLASRLVDYMHLTPKPPKNRFAPTIPLTPYSHGLGAVGLPGDFSSPSRFVRAAFHLHNAAPDGIEEERIRQVFHILRTVFIPRGSVRLGDGRYHHTLYAACLHAEAGVYYVSTHLNSRICGIDMHRADLNGTKPMCYPLPAVEPFPILN